MTSDTDRGFERLPGQRINLPGIGAQALLLVNSFKDKFKVEFLGASRNSFLIITMPLYRGATDRLQENENVGIAFQQSGSLYQFNTHVLLQQLRPTPILYLAWPKSATRRELRAATRYPCALPMTVTLDGETHPGVITDLSRSGVGVALKAEHRSPLRGLAAGGRVTVNFSLGEYGEILGAMTIRRVDALPDAVKLGLSLDGLDEGEQEILTDFLDRVAASWHFEP